MSLDFSPSPNENLSATVNSLINAALEAESAQEKRRTYLGASAIGGECERRLGYEYHGHARDPFPGKTIRRFRLGHIHEDESVRWLRLAGFNVQTHRPDGGQWGFSLADGRFAGHVDGVIMSGPAIGLVYPGILEHKVMRSDIWRACDRDGVKKNHPTYYAQTQIYMRQFGCAWCLFTALNTDTSELLFEIVDYNEAEANALIEKAARIIESKAPEELPRVAANEMDFRCKWCPFRVECWQRGQRGVEAAPRPAWLART